MMNFLRNGVKTLVMVAMLSLLASSALAEGDSLLRECQTLLYVSKQGFKEVPNTLENNARLVGRAEGIEEKLNLKNGPLAVQLQQVRTQQNKFFNISHTYTYGNLFTRLYRFALQNPDLVIPLKCMALNVDVLAPRIPYDFEHSSMRTTESTLKEFFPSSYMTYTNLSDRQKRDLVITFLHVYRFFNTHDNRDPLNFTPYIMELLVDKEITVSSRARDKHTPFQVEHFTDRKINFILALLDGDFLKAREILTVDPVISLCSLLNENLCRRVLLMQQGVK